MADRRGGEAPDFDGPALIDGAKCALILDYDNRAFARRSTRAATPAGGRHPM